MKNNKLKCKVIMLPQQDYFQRAENNESHITGIMLHGSGMDPFYENTLQDEGKWLKSILDIGGKPQRLYFISEREMKKNDWIIYSLTKEVLQIPSKTVCKYPEYWKIESTTDKSLDLPLIPESFIKQYVEKEGKIDEVNLEYISGIKGFVDRVNCRGDNTVIISNIISEIENKEDLFRSRLEEIWEDPNHDNDSFFESIVDLHQKNKLKNSSKEKKESWNDIFKYYDEYIVEKDIDFLKEYLIKNYQPPKRK